MRLSRALLTTLFLIFPLIAKAQSRAAICYVNSHFVSDDGFTSGNYNLGSFQTKVVDQPPTVRTFKYDDRGVNLVVSVSIDFDFDSSNSYSTPRYVRLAVAASEKEYENPFESKEDAAADTRFVRRWNLGVVKKVYRDGRVYSFSLNCKESRGSK